MVCFKIFYQPVGEVDVGLSVGWSGVVFKEAGDADSEVREGENFPLPVFEDVHVGEYDDLSCAALSFFVYLQDFFREIYHPNVQVTQMADSCVVIFTEGCYSIGSIRGSCSVKYARTEST